MRSLQTLTVFLLIVFHVASQATTKLNCPTAPTPPPTKPPPPPFNCTAPQKYAGIYVDHRALVYNQGYGRGNFAGVCKNTDNGAFIYMDGRTPQIVVKDNKSAAGTLHQAIIYGCSNPCLCVKSNECYLPNPNDRPEMVMYPHCDNTGACYFAVFLSIPGSLIPAPGSTAAKTYTYAAQFAANGAQYPISNASVYLRIASVNCGACPFVIPT